MPELAGKGGRSSEKAYKSIAGAADDITKMILTLVGNDRYVIFGHSMGALLAYETYYRLLDCHCHSPEHLFFSGRRPPEMEDKEKYTHLHDDLTFLKTVSFFGGIPEAMYEPEIMNIYLPILKADFKILGEYIFRPKLKKIQCDVTVLYGDEDSSTPGHEMEGWRAHTRKRFQMHKFQGGHFFINQEVSAIVSLIVDAAKGNEDNGEIGCHRRGGHWEHLR